MKNLVLFLLSVEIGFVAAVDVQSSATAIADIYRQDISLAGRQSTRQVQRNCTDEQIENFFPPRCLAAARESNGTGRIGELDPDALARFGATFCDPECGNPLLELYETCFDDSVGEQLSAFVIQLCAQNSQGRRCYSEDVATLIREMCVLGIDDPCEAACRSAVETTVAASGCCINNLDFGGATPVTFFLALCNVDIPGPCSGSTLGPQGTPTTPVSETMPPNSGCSETVAQAMSILLGSFTVLMTAALQDHL